MPPSPAPPPLRGRGRFIVILCKGLRPLHPWGLNLRGTGAGASHVRGGRLAPALPADLAAVVPCVGACFLCRLPALPLAFFYVPYPPRPRSQSALPRRGRGRFIVILCKGLRPLHPRGLNPGGTGLSRCSDCLGRHFPWNRHERRPNNRFIREKFWGVWGTLSRVPRRSPASLASAIRRDFFLKTSCFFSADGV